MSTPSRTRRVRASGGLLALGLAFATMGAAAPASAANSETPNTRDEILSVVESVAPHLTGSSTRDIAGSLPKAIDDTLVVGTQRIGLSPAVDPAGAQRVPLSDGAVAFVDDSTTWIVSRLGSTGVALSTIINERSAESFAYDYSLADGVVAEPAEAGGILFTLGDEVVGGVLPPWAVDAEGRTVPTHYAIDNHRIVQVVEHIGLGFAYPIVADPTYYGESLISYVTATSSPWETHVYTSQWFRNNITIGNNVVRYQVTDEYARIMPSTYDTTGARQQVSCHAWTVALKVPWNIELWRPTVGEAATVAAACNP